MSKLIVCGEAQEATTLCNYLLHYERLTLGQEVEVGRPLPPPGTSEACIQVKNKYFSASVQLVCVAPSTENAAELLRGITNDGESPEDNSSTAAAEGFVRVLSQPEAERAIETGTEKGSDELRIAHADLRLALAAVEGDLPVRLLVVLCQRGESAGEREGLSESARCAWVSWACDNGFELIEVPCHSLAALRATHDEREKEGLPRVVEALGSHMWRSGERPREGVKGTPRLQGATVASELVAATSTTGAGAGGGQSASAFVSEHSHSPTPAADVKKEDENPFLPLGAPGQGDASSDRNGNGGGDAEDSEQAVFDIIHQARALREAVSSGKVSDEERRARAEQMALRFAAMIDLAGEESDSD
jgi:hypothetical protein